MDDAMANGGEPSAVEIVLDPGKYITEQTVVFQHAARAALLEQRPARGIAHHDARDLLLLVKQALALQRWLGRRDVEQAELDAGRAGVENQDAVGHRRSLSRSL